MLNILPPDRKITLRRAYVSKQLQLLVGVGIVATSLAVAMVFASDWMLQRWLNNAAVAAKTDLITPEDRIELKSLVSQLTVSVNQAQPLLLTTQQPLTDIKTLLEPTPESISLHTFTLTYVDQLLRITGTAQSRDDLVSYQQLLTTLPGISNVKLPLSDLSQRESITFTITATYETPSL